MKQTHETFITQWTIVLLFVFAINGQAQQLIIKDKTFALLTPFIPLSNDKFNVFQIAMGQTTDKNSYILFVENHSNDFNVKTLDTTRIVDLLMNTYFPRSRNGSTWKEEQNLILPVFKKNVLSNSKGILIAFSLSGTDAFDIKGQQISSLTIHSIDNSGKYRSETKNQLGVAEPAKKFFVTYASKILSKQSSFDDATKYKSNRIRLYSLFFKDINFVNGRLGNPKTTEQKETITTNSYETPQGEYIIEFRENKSLRIEFHPKMKFKYIGRLFIIDSYPMEISGCNCGDFIVSEAYKAVGNKQCHEIIFTYKDKPAHVINFWSDGGNYLDKVIVDEN